MIETQKRCTKCGEMKELERFSISAKQKLGRQSWCKVCHNAHDKRQRELAKERFGPVTEGKLVKVAPKVVEAPAFEQMFGMLMGQDGGDDRRLQLAAHILDIQAEVLKELIRRG